MWQIILSFIAVLAAVIYLIRKYTSGNSHCDPNIEKCSMCDLKDSCGKKIVK